MDPAYIVLTLVLRVRFTTLPALMMRSNSKQPFWLTGDMTPMAALAALMLSIWGCAGASSSMPAERMLSGVAGGGGCAPSPVVAMLANYIQRG